jgi:hypothetical protein
MSLEHTGLIERQLWSIAASPNTSTLEVLEGNRKTDYVEDKNEESKSYPQHARKDKPVSM